MSKHRENEMSAPVLLVLITSPYKSKLHLRIVSLYICGGYISTTNSYNKVYMFFSLPAPLKCLFQVRLLFYSFAKLRNSLQKK